MRHWILQNTFNLYALPFLWNILSFGKIILFHHFIVFMSDLALFVSLLVLTMLSSITFQWSILNCPGVLLGPPSHLGLLSVYVICRDDFPLCNCMSWFVAAVCLYRDILFTTSATDIEQVLFCLCWCYLLDFAEYWNLIFVWFIISILLSIYSGHSFFWDLLAKKEEKEVHKSGYGFHQWNGGNLHIFRYQIC